MINMQKKIDQIIESIWIQWDNHTNEETLNLVNGVITGLQKMKKSIDTTIEETNE